ncbi:MAG: hypothetical protein QME96_06380, partial [Myxococcota bacterium]|nr:hypothetical protein [Myxococcota bacterium]
MTAAAAAVRAGPAVPKTVGGQAVIEGVMMRAPRCMAVAVRRPDGGIVVLDRPWRSIWERLRFLRRPFLRGSVVLVESIANGMSALSYSARVAGEAAAAAADGVGLPGA